MTTNQWRWWWVKLMLNNIMILVYLHRLMLPEQHDVANRSILKMNSTKKFHFIRVNLIILLIFVFYVKLLRDHNENISIIAFIWFRGKKIKMQIANHSSINTDRYLPFYLFTKFIISQVTFWLLPFSSVQENIHAHEPNAHILDRWMRINGLPFSI